MSPYNNYHFTITAPNFQAAERELDVRGQIPVDVPVSLKIATGATTVEVNADAGDLIENVPDTHTDVDRGLFEKLPLENQSSEALTM